jgi:Flp pilus assembly protein TadD
LRSAILIANGLLRSSVNAKKGAFYGLYKLPQIPDRRLRGQIAGSLAHASCLDAEVRLLRSLFRHSLAIEHYVFAIVFALRVIVLARLTSSPFLLPRGGDMHFYDQWAQRILQGHLTDHLAFYGLPGYAYLLALLYEIFGYNPFVPGLLQAVLDAVVAVLIYQLALQIFPASPSFALGSRSRLGKFPKQERARVLGVIAALGWAFFVPAQAYAVILMPTVWFIFAFWFVVWRIVRNNNAPTGKECLLLGLLIGFSAMGIATTLILVPFVLAALLIKPEINNGRWRTFALGAALLFASVGLGTSPCWIHNYLIARDPVFLSAHSGINFWIGNNPEANGYPRFPPGLRAGQAAMLQDSIAQAETSAGYSLKRSEVSAYWSAKAKSYIATHFSDWLKLLALKARNFWSSFQYDDLSIITNLREQGVTLPGVYFGLVAALAIPGMLLAWKIVPESRWVLLAILLSMLALLPVFITERYRLVAVPGLLIFAACGLSIFSQAVMTSRFRVTAAYLVLLAGATIFVAWPQRSPSLWALDAYNSGWQALESQNFPLAEKKLAIAYAYVQTNPETNFALGNLRLAEGQNDAASAFYLATLSFNARHRGALNNLGVMALNTGRYDTAENWLRQAEDVDPNNAKTHYLLAQVLLAAHDLENAHKEIDRALELDPKQPEFSRFRQRVVDQ